MPLHAHIVATRPGHAINAELTKLLFEKLAMKQKKGGKKRAAAAVPKTILATETSLDIRPAGDGHPAASLSFS